MSGYVTVRHPDDQPRRMRLAPEEISRACQRRFEVDAVCVTTPKRNVFKWDPQNWWDGWTPITRLPNGNLEFTRVYGDIEEFDLEGRTVNVRSR